MQYGSPLPITALAEPAATRAYAQSLEQAGFDFTATAGHVLAQPPGTHPDRPNRLYAGPFYDPFVTFASLAACTTRLRFMSAILILPAWPAAIVAQQAAELAEVSGGRFALGVGISWNRAEYRALGQDFATRGRRLEEQLLVIRRLWAEDYVTFSGEFHSLDRVGLNRGPIPHIPIWFGTETSERALRRVARLADGWMPLGDPAPDLARLKGYMREAGRDARTLQVRASLAVGDGDEAAWIAEARRLGAASVTHLNITAPPTMAADEALARVSAARNAIASALG